MPRLTKLEEILFPVQEHPVFVSFSDGDVSRQLAVPEKKAIVNRTSHRVLGVVSRGYRLVSNKEALDMAYQCCSTVFPNTKPGEWGVKAIDAPNTAGHCYIDLAHNSTVLDFFFVPANQRPDLFGPFIRVTNSYNGLRALGFDIGFYRKVCKNGMIMPDSIIRFKFNHQRSEIGKTIQFEVAKQRLAKLTTIFTDSLTGLRNCAVQLPQFESLVCGALSLTPPNEPDERQESDWEDLRDHLAEMSGRYVSELGENAYAAFNTITEFASHPPDNRCLHRDRHSLQRLAGSWLTSFRESSRRPGFSITSHLDELAKERAKTSARAPDQNKSERQRIWELETIS